MYSPHDIGPYGELCKGMTNSELGRRGSTPRNYISRSEVEKC